MLNLITMQANLEKINSTKVKLNVEANQAELTQAKDQAIKKLGVNVRLPGFRAGKTPASMLEKAIDPNTLGQETLEIIVNKLYLDAVMANQLRPINTPEITIKTFVPYSELTFDAEVDIVGDVVLGKYKKLGIVKKPVTVTQTEVNDVLKRMQKQLATKNEVKRDAKNEDEVVIDFDGFDAKTNDPINGASGKDYPLILGSNSFIPGFEEGLLGSKANEEKEIKLTFPADYGVASLKSKKVIFKTKVKSVNELVLPKLDDVFAKLVGPFNTVEELKKDIKDELTKTKNDQVLSDFQNAIVEKVVNSSSVDIPERLAEEETARIETEQRQNAAYNGLTWNEYLENQGLNEESFKSLAQEQAKVRIKTGLILGEVASSENISINNEEYNSKINALKKQYASDQKMQEELNNPKNQQDLKNRLMVEKTVEYLVSQN